MGNRTLTTTNKARSLGIVFDDNMLFDAHVSDIYRSSFYQLKNLSKISKYLTQESSEIALHAFITYKLDYCNSIVPNKIVKRCHFYHERFHDASCKVTVISQAGLLRREKIMYSCFEKGCQKKKKIVKAYATVPKKMLEIPNKFQ